MTQLYFASGPHCTCVTIDDVCDGCVFARWTDFVRGWSWVSVAIERHAVTRGRS